MGRQPMARSWKGMARSWKRPESARETLHGMRRGTVLFTVVAILLAGSSLLLAHGSGPPITTFDEAVPVSLAELQQAGATVTDLDSGDSVAMEDLPSEATECVFSACFILSDNTCVDCNSHCGSQGYDFSVCAVGSPQCNGYIACACCNN